MLREWQRHWKNVLYFGENVIYFGENSREEIRNLGLFDNLICKSYFDNFQSVFKYFQVFKTFDKTVGTVHKILSWKSKRLPKSAITPAPNVTYIYNSKTVKFQGNCSKQDTVSYSWKCSKHFCLWIRYVQVIYALILH